MTPTDQQYHHGDLPNALRRAAAQVITEKGLGGFSLREVARRAGVSHAAPAHHFGDTTGLLTSLAVEAFVHLEQATATAAAQQTNPVDRLIAIGRAYVNVGIDHPAHCQVLFRHDVLNSDDPAYREAGDAAYRVLEATLEDVAAAINPDLNIDQAAKLCWAAMQGLVVLYDNMSSLDHNAGLESTAIDDMVAQFTSLIVNGLRA